MNASTDAWLMKWIYCWPTQYLNPFPTLQERNILRNHNQIIINSVKLLSHGSSRFMRWHLIRVNHGNGILIWCLYPRRLKQRYEYYTAQLAYLTNKVKLSTYFASSLHYLQIIREVFANKIFVAFANYQIIITLHHQWNIHRDCSIHIERECCLGPASADILLLLR